MCEDIARNFYDKRTCCCITTTHRPTLIFSPGNFYKKQHDWRPPPTLIALLGRCNFSLAENNFQNAFKSGRSTWNGAYARKGTSRMMLGMVAPVPEIMDTIGAEHFPRGHQLHSQSRTSEHFFGSRRFITAFTRALHWFITWTKLIQRIFS
jgi:hypothetical protein